MLYQGAIALCLALFMVNLIQNMRSLHKLGAKDGELPEQLPFISVLVPARDEESDIATCVESLRRQDYPHFEVLVLDDNSSDNTATVVQRIAAVDPKVRLLRGDPLPKGRAGKPFACQQLASQAKGSWLLFTDADTVHAPGVLRSALAYAHSNKLSLLSGFPLQRSVSFSQRVIIPMMYFIILSWLPIWWLQGSKTPKPGFVIGQFIFVSARDYWEVGGHEAVKSRIIEDMWFGFEMARRGKRQAAVDLSEMVSCRMYEELGDLWEGITKWTYSVSALSPWALGFLVVAGVGFFVVPFAYLVWHFIPMNHSYGSVLLIAIQVAVVLMMRALVDRRFHNNRVFSLSHPIGISFWMVCAVCGAITRLTGGGVRWKHRLYSRGSGIE